MHSGGALRRTIFNWTSLDTEDVVHLDDLGHLKYGI